MRVVLDTNILISGCWKPGGNESRVVAMACEGLLTPCVSKIVVDEYRDVLARRKFVNHRECLERTVDKLLATAVFTRPEVQCTVCTDADDNRLLECALAGGAAYVVTGNLRHFPAEWEGVRTINARGLLDLAL